MKLRRLYVSQFKQFSHPFELNGLNDGLVVITGANEAGKSTLSLALRSAFFERHNTSTVEFFRPYGDSSARPEVHLEFEINTQPALLQKRFLRQAACDLSLGSERYDGTAAEEHLAEQLGFSLRKRGGSGPDDWGVPGLLWVQQGELHKLAQAVNPATSHLGEALGASVGALASSDSDGVLAEVERRLAELVTGTGKPRADYDKAIKEQASLAAEVAALAKDAATYKELVDHLENLGLRFRREQEAQVWNTLRAQIPALKTEVIQAEQREAQLLQLTTDIKTLEQERQYISQALENAQAEQTRYMQLVTMAAQFEESIAKGLGQLQQAEKTRSADQAALKKAQAQRQAATASAQLRTQQREHEQLEHRLKQLYEAKQSVEQLLKQQRQMQAEAVAVLIKNDDIKTLRKAEHDTAVLQAQLAMASTRLDFDLNHSGLIKVSGRPLHELEQSMQISEKTSIEITGIGTVDVSPGGEDLAKLRAQLDAAQEYESSLLARLSVADLTQAEQRYREQEKRQIEFKRIEGLVAIHAPAGMHALEQEIDGLTKRLQSIPMQDFQELTCELSVDDAYAIEQTAQIAVERSEQILQKLNQSRIETTVRLSSINEEITRLNTRVNSETHAAQAQGHQQRLTETSVKITQAVKRKEELEARRMHGRSAADIQNEIDGLESRAAQAERGFYDLKLELSKVETELQIVGAQGLDEQLASKQAALHQIAQRCDQFRQRAEILEHLKQRLIAARSSLRERLQAPLLERINYYLEFLFPGARIELDDSFVPKVLHREDSNSAELLDLSFGALEQVAVISRLAYADLLKKAGRPTLIVLDDVLSYSDEQRLARMKTAIYDASKRHQILLFTCSPHLWNDAGGQIINIEQQKLRRPD